MTRDLKSSQDFPELRRVALGWRRLFSVLAVRRTRHLLQTAGLPIEPRGYQALLTITRDFLSHVEKGRSTDHVQSVLAARDRSLAALASQCGDAAVEKLRTWALPHFIPLDEYMVLEAWRGLFPLLTEMWSDIHLAGPTRASQSAVVQPIVSRYFNDDFYGMLVYQTAFASGLPMSPSERAIERTFHWVPEGRGAVGAATDAALRQRALLCWHDLEASTDLASRAHLIQEGKRLTLGRKQNYKWLPTLDSQAGIVSDYPCPCCGHFTFHKWPPGMASSYDICPVCYWEDDAVQANRPTADGPNAVTLQECRRNYGLFGASERRFKKLVRLPTPHELAENGGASGQTRTRSRVLRSF